VGICSNLLHLKILACNRNYGKHLTRKWSSAVTNRQRGCSVSEWL